MHDRWHHYNEFTSVIRFVKSDQAIEHRSTEETDQRTRHRSQPQLLKRIKSGQSLGPRLLKRILQIPQLRSFSL